MMKRRTVKQINNEGILPKTQTNDEELIMKNLDITLILDNALTAIVNIFAVFAMVVSLSSMANADSSQDYVMQDQAAVSQAAVSTVAVD